MRALCLVFKSVAAELLKFATNREIIPVVWSARSGRRVKYHISYRTGNDYREPFNPQGISKHIFALTHVSGYKYGTNFFNADFLISDKNDPASLNQSGGAQEAYILYRNTFDLGKISGKAIKFSPVSGVGITAGFDVNTKNDVGNNSRKRMLVLGPT